MATDLDDNDSLTDAAHDSPWRPVFDEVRRLAAGARDDVGAVGSINWLRDRMERLGANPNVVRNIIYRDKGRLPDKRALYEVMCQLWRELTGEALEVPALDWLGSPYAAAEQEVMQVLGREQRRAYRALIGGVREQIGPKVIVTGRPGSGKTILTDYLQEGLALEASSGVTVTRVEFVALDVADTLARLASAVGVSQELIESRLMRVTSGSAFAVQADAQVELARLVMEGVNQRRNEQLVLLIRLSRGLSKAGSLAGVPLRLNNPDVERVSALDWLWLNLLRPLSTVPELALFISLAELPPRAQTAPGAFGAPIRLSPPTVTESRRFVKARLPDADEAVVERIVTIAGRSYEELRTLALLARARASDLETGEDPSRALEQLSLLSGPAGETELRSFLGAFGVLATPDFDGFPKSVLVDLLGRRRRRLSEFELSFLDPVPQVPEYFRPFSRQLARLIDEQLAVEEPERHRELHSRAANWYQRLYHESGGEEASSRFLHHALEAGEWTSVASWLEENALPYQLLQSVWRRARDEQIPREQLESIAQHVASHFVRLGAYEHDEAVRAFEMLSASDDAVMRAWAAGKRAEGEVAHGRFERALALLDSAPETTDRTVRAVHTLARAGVERWRGSSLTAERELAQAAASFRERGEPRGRAERSLLARLQLAEGLLRKDRGELLEAHRLFADSSLVDDNLTRSRLAFQRGDVLARLGLVDTALREFDLSVSLAQRSEALDEELSRILARRGDLLRQRGDLTAARSSFERAKEKLERVADRAEEAYFWRARLADEEAYTLLAEGRFEEAALSLTAALAAFRDYQKRHGVDAGFRVLRAALKLGVSYALQDLRQPLRRPFSAVSLRPLAPGGPTATDGIDDVLAAIEEELQGESARGANGHLLGLRHDALLFASLLGDPTGPGVGWAKRAVAVSSTHFERAKAHSASASVALRLGEADDASDHTAAADAEFEAALAAAPPGSLADERGDLGIRAQLAGSRSAALFLQGDVEGAADALCDALEDENLRLFHEDLLRTFGATVETLRPGPGWLRHRRLRSLIGINGTGPSTPARLPDALVAAWRSRRAPVVV